MKKSIFTKQKEEELKNNNSSSNENKTDIILAKIYLEMSEDFLKILIRANAKDELINKEKLNIERLKNIINQA